MLFGLTQFTPESAYSLYDNLEFLIRILVAGVLGMLIGIERTKRWKEAGVRTHCIIAIAAATFMIISKYSFADLEVGALGARGADPARIAAQVVSGISFLGAGVIFKTNGGIKGLTTAAGMWATAAVGMSIGSGMYWIGIIETALLMLVQVVLHRHPIGGDSVTIQLVSVTMKNEENLRRAFQDMLDRHNASVEESKISMRGDQFCMDLTLRVEKPITHTEAMDFLESYPGVTEMSV